MQTRTIFQQQHVIRKEKHRVAARCPAGRYTTITVHIPVTFNIVPHFIILCNINFRPEREKNAGFSKNMII